MTSSIRGIIKTAAFYENNDVELINILNARCNDKRRRTVDSVVLFLNNWVIKQLFHGYFGNSQPWSLSRAKDMGSCCPKLSQIFSTYSGQ